MSDDPTTEAEILSAYLDGEATPEEVARVEADPALRAQVAALDAVRKRLAVDGPPPGMVDEHVQAALAAFDGDASSTHEEAPADEVSARRRRLLQRIPLGAVAAVVAVLALFGALTQIDRGDEDSASSDVATDAMLEADDSAGTDDLQEDSAGDLAPGAGGDGSGTYSTGAADVPLAFSDTDELADHLAATYGELAPSNDPATTDAGRSGPAPDGQDEERAVDPCDAVAVTGADPSTITVILPAFVGGVPVTALITETGTDQPVRRLVVVDDRTCSVIDDRSL